MRKIFIIIATLLLGVNVGAAPSISSVTWSGDLDHGVVVTISGTDFGAKSTAAPFLWDSVDNITSYSSVQDGDSIPVGGSHPWPNNYSNSVKMETSDSMRHSYSSKMYKTSGTDGFFNEHDLPNNPSTGIIYVGYWWKPDADPTAGSHSSKFVRISDQTDIPGKTFSWTQMHNYVHITGENTPTEWDSWTGNVNQWNFHEVIMISSEERYYIYVNGTLLTDCDWSVVNQSVSYDQLNTIGWDGGGSSPPSITAWMDDIYLDNTLARVVIGNASTYASSTHREMQIPTDWGTTEITITVNQGSFSNGTAYLYVIDEDGDANSSGEAITFGEVNGTTGEGITGIGITLE